MKKIYIIALINQIIFGDQKIIKTIFKPLSQSMHLQTQYHKPMYDPESIFNANFQVHCYYQATRESNYIVENLFQYNPLLFQGETLLDGDLGRDEKALVAPYFGLKTNTNISLELVPKIQNTVIDLQLNLESERYWLQTNFPIVRSKWQLHKDDQLKITGTYGDIELQDQGNAMIFGQYSTSGNPIVITPTPYQFSVDGQTFLSQVGSSQDLIDQLFGTCNIDSDYDDQNYDSIENPVANSYLGVGFWGKSSFYIADTKYDISNPGTFTIENQTTNSLSSQINDILHPQENVDSNKIYTDSMLIINQPEVNGTDSLEKALGGYTFGDLKEKKYGLFNFSNTELQEKLEIADINIQCGYDFIKNKKGHLGIYFKIIVPTGTEIGLDFQRYVFSPIIGNGKHFECGAGVNGHYMINEKKYNSSYIHFDGYMTHMFSTKQFRVFDKNNLPMSRYAIVKELHYDTTANSTFDDMYAYNHILKVLGDVNCDWVDISIGLKGEALFDFIHKYKNWEFGAGYCFAGQTRENLEYKKYTPATVESKFNQNSTVYGFKGTTCCDTIIFKTSNDDSVVYKYDSSGLGGSWIQGKTNGDVTVDGTSGAYKYGTGTSSGEGAIGTTSKDVFILPDISNDNRTGLMEAQILHKIFGHIDYIWSDIQWEPKMGIFGSFGFSPTKYQTADYWDLGIKFGFIF
jgi:hypothetical protein